MSELKSSWIALLYSSFDAGKASLASLDFFLRSIKTCKLRMGRSTSNWKKAYFYSRRRQIPTSDVKSVIFSHQQSANTINSLIPHPREIFVTFSSNMMMLKKSVKRNLFLVILFICSYIFVSYFLEGRENGDNKMKM